jgi:RNA polymerase sigma-70 factor, ECF subfamily
MDPRGEYGEFSSRSVSVPAADGWFGYSPSRLMPSRPAGQRDLTHLLQQWSGGHREALDPLFAKIYGELRGLARSHLARENRDHTLQPTELVHEAFARLVQQKVSWQNRGHFFGIAAQCMRRILVDHARKKKAAKRPSSRAAEELREDLPAPEEASDRILIVDEALTRLAASEPRLASVVDLKYFAGLTIDEIAEVTGTSPATVKRDWEEAKQVLLKALGGAG